MSLETMHMINPSELQLDTLPFVALCDHKQLPARSAVYLAIDSSGAVQYVGQTENLRKRWKHHHRHNQLNSVGEIRIAYIECPPDLLLDIESALIEWFNPPLNGLLKASSRAESSSVKCRLKEFLDQRELTQQKFAAEADLSPTTVGQLYRNSFRRLDNGTVESVCRYFKVELGDMFYIAAEEPESA